MEREAVVIAFAGTAGHPHRRQRRSIHVERHVERAGAGHVEAQRLAAEGIHRGNGDAGPGQRLRRRHPGSSRPGRQNLSGFRGDGRIEVLEIAFEIHGLRRIAVSLQAVENRHARVARGVLALLADAAKRRDQGRSRLRRMALVFERADRRQH